MGEFQYSAEVEAHTMRAIFHIARWTGVTFGVVLFISGLYEYITTQDRSGAVMGIFSLGSLYIAITVTGISTIAFFLTPVIRHRMPSYRLTILQDDIWHAIENLENSKYILPSAQADVNALRDRLADLDIPMPDTSDTSAWADFLPALYGCSVTGNIRKARYLNDA